MKSLLISLLLWLPLMAHYSLKPSHRHPSAIDHLPKGKFADMRRIPQDPSYYASQITKPSLWSQYSAKSNYNKRYFLPWDIDRLSIDKEAFGWEIRFIKRNKIYTRYGKPITASTYNRWIANALYSHRNSVAAHAITIKRTDLKALPTRSAFYKNPRKTGEGFPFDYNQNSALHIHIPLFISHYSRDKNWAFVQASYGFGWVRRSDIALVDSGFKSRFRSLDRKVLIKDNARLYQNNSPLSLIKMGALFPYSNNQTYVVAKKGGFATLEPLETSSLLLAPHPYEFTPAHVAAIAKELYNEPYGWGGGYGCRDCSATTRDFMGVFGHFLSRNSGKQAKDGAQIAIRNWPKWYKKRFIIQNAQPFRSLLYVPGHIVLYLGHYKKEPVIMHTYWGVRKKDGTKFITARTIITTTEPAREKPWVKERSKLINTLRTIINF